MILGSAAVAYDYMPSSSASSSAAQSKKPANTSASELGAAPWRYLATPQLNTIDELSQLPDNWDGYGSSKTTPQIAAKARRTLIGFYDKYYPINLFVEPFIVMNDEGEIVFEWWREHRKLTLYIGDSSRFVKSWGPDIFADMDDGELEGNGEDIPDDLWRWIYG